MGGRNCFVPGCKSGYTRERKLCKIEGKRNPSLFFAPSDPVQLMKWKLAICRADMELTRKHCVCELHFSKDDVMRFYETKLFDGTIYKMAKAKPMLKPGAIPKIFPLHTSPLSKTVLNLKSSAENVVTKKCKQRKSETECFATQPSAIEDAVVVPSPCEGSSSDLPVTAEYQSVSSVEVPPATVAPVEAESDNNVIQMSPLKEGMVAELTITAEPLNTENDIQMYSEKVVENFTFSKLLENLNYINTPKPSLWSITPIFTFVICARWNASSGLEKKVVIENNLNFKIFFRDRETCIADSMKITCIDDISSLLVEVEEHGICKGVTDRSMETCLGCLPKRGDSVRISYWCSECRHLKRKMYRKNAQTPNKKPNVARKKLYQRVLNAERKYFRLQTKVASLCKEMVNIKKSCLAEGDDMLTDWDSLPDSD